MDFVISKKNVVIFLYQKFDFQISEIRFSDIRNSIFDIKNRISDIKNQDYFLISIRYLSGRTSYAYKIY